MNIKKRNGKIVPFNEEKIFSALNKANTSVEKKDRISKKDIRRLVKNLKTKMSKSKEWDVEKIQNYIEIFLMQNGYYILEREYSSYRFLHKMARENYQDFMQEIKRKLEAKEIQNQNANVDEASFGGRMGEANRLVMKRFALDNCMSKMSRQNHLNNEIYIHDLDSYAVGMHNCLSIPFDKLLAEGFNTRQTDIRPANSINTAFQLVAVIFQLQSLQQFGGVSATHLDWTMVPYVRKSFKKHFNDGMSFIEKKDFSSCQEMSGENSITDEFYKKHPKVYDYALLMTEKELTQAVEGMYHNLNTLQSRSGNQLPFTSINYGTCTLPEGRMVIKALLNGSLEGIGRFHKTPIFPCGIFQSSKKINRYPGTPNYDLYQLALKSTSKRLYPNYANIDWSGNEGYDEKDPKTYFSTMGCRTANGVDINAEPGVNPQTKDGRGNIAPVTIILPTLAMEAEEEACLHNSENGFKNVVFQDEVIDIFFEILNKKLEEAKDMLIERFDWICSQSMESAKFMYENGTMIGYHPEEGIRSALKHGTLAIGQIGLAETLQILIGQDQTDKDGVRLAQEIETLFKEKCSEYKEKYKLNFGVYYTPAENLCYTSMQKFKEKYGDIPNVSDKEFFTNSIHVPVWKKVTPFEKIDIESQLTGYSSAGCITYVEFDSSIENNLPALEKVVTYAMEKDIPYFAVNVPCDTCMDCGYSGDLDTCPMCGSKNIQRLRRVTGYLTGDYKTAFNKGKQQETEMRFKHGTLMED